MKLAPWLTRPFSRMASIAALAGFVVGVVAGRSFNEDAIGYLVAFAIVMMVGESLTGGVRGVVTAIDDIDAEDRPVNVAMWRDCRRLEGELKKATDDNVALASLVVELRRVLMSYREQPDYLSDLRPTAGTPTVPTSAEPSGGTPTK